MDKSEGLIPVTGGSEISFSTETLDFLDSVKKIDQETDSGQAPSVKTICDLAVERLEATLDDYGIQTNFGKYEKEEIVIIDDNFVREIKNVEDRDTLTTLSIVGLEDPRSNRKKIIIVNQDYLDKYPESFRNRLFKSTGYPNDPIMVDVERKVFNEWWKERNIIRSISNMVVNPDIPDGFAYGGVDSLAIAIVREIYPTLNYFRECHSYNIGYRKDSHIAYFNDLFDYKYYYAFARCVRAIGPDVMRLLMGEELKYTSREIILDTFNEKLKHVNEKDY